MSRVVAQFCSRDRSIDVQIIFNEQRRDAISNEERRQSCWPVRSSELSIFTSGAKATGQAVEDQN